MRGLAVVLLSIMNLKRFYNGPSIVALARRALELSLKLANPGGACGRDTSKQVTVVEAPSEGDSIKAAVFIQREILCGVSSFSSNKL